LGDPPIDPDKSKLEAHKAGILRWRQQGKTYKAIREALAERCGITVAHSTLVEFIKRRRRQAAAAKPAWQYPRPAVQSSIAKPAMKLTDNTTIGQDWTLTDNPSIRLDANGHERFYFDESLPLTNKPAADRK